MKSSKHNIISTQDKNTIALFKIFQSKSTGLVPANELNTIQLPLIMHYAAKGINFVYRDSKSNKTLLDIAMELYEQGKCDPLLIAPLINAASESDLRITHTLERAISANNFFIIELIIKKAPHLAVEIIAENETVAALLKGTALSRDLPHIYVDCAGLKGQAAIKAIADIQNMGYIHWCQELIEKYQKKITIAKKPYAEPYRESLINEIDNILNQIFPRNYPELIKYALQNKFITPNKMELLLDRMYFVIFPIDNLQDMYNPIRNYQIKWDEQFWAPYLRSIIQTAKTQGGMQNAYTAYIIIKSYSVISFIDNDINLLKMATQRLQASQLFKTLKQRTIDDIKEQVEYSYSLHSLKGVLPIDVSELKIMMIKTYIPLLRYFLNTSLSLRNNELTGLLKSSYAIAMDKIDADEVEMLEFAQIHDEYYGQLGSFADVETICPFEKFQEFKTLNMRCTLNAVYNFAQKHQDIIMPNELLDKIFQVNFETLHEAIRKHKANLAAAVPVKIIKQLQLYSDTLLVYLHNSHIFSQDIFKKFEDIDGELTYILTLLTTRRSLILSNINPEDTQELHKNEQAHELSDQKMNNHESYLLQEPDMMLLGAEDMQCT
jgi:hypothetical protein